jgi:NAD(P)-dependent dehydrogenase (short-subunit alcohol dehydrogenase family)
MRNLLDYQGKRVVVTGAASGMGEAAARVVAGLGGDVVAIDIRKPKLDSVRYLEVDLRDVRAIEAAVAEIARGGPINALMNCAGLPGGSFPAPDVMQVNFIGLRHLTETCIPHMKRGDAIGSISSGAGVGYLGNMANVKALLAIADPGKARAWVEEHQKDAWFEPYSFSKQCIIVYTLHRAASLTAEEGIRLNCISPGPTDTAMMPHFIKHVGQDFMDRYPKPIGRNSTAEEQGWPLAFLCSAAASYVSGENLFTDGGTCGGLMTGAIDASLLTGVPAKK